MEILKDLNSKEDQKKYMLDQGFTEEELEKMEDKVQARVQQQFFDNLSEDDKAELHKRFLQNFATNKEKRNDVLNSLYKKDNTATRVMKKIFNNHKGV